MVTRYRASLLARMTNREMWDIFVESFRNDIKRANMQFHYVS